MKHFELINGEIVEGDVYMSAMPGVNPDHQFLGSTNFTEKYFRG